MTEEITFKISKGKEFKRERAAAARIDSAMCVNCGICRRNCPVETIDEHQRDICRLCPDCSPAPKMFPEESQRFAPQHACSLQCPLGTIPEGYVNMAAQGRFDLAYDLIAELNPLPVVCAMICHHPCEDDCKRGLTMDKPIAIRGLKRFVVEKVSPRPLNFDPHLGKKVGIIGAGPAGLTAAADLAAKGYTVKIFEAGSEPGGMIWHGVPDFRLDKAKFAGEVRRLIDAGIEIEYGCSVGTKPSVKDLLADKFDAILIAVGAAEGTKLPIPGAGAENVYDALTVMKHIHAKKPLVLGKKAVVVGGGSVALDTARTLMRMGLEASCACLESGKELPAPAWEQEEAKEEGVKIIEGVSPVRVITDWFTVKGMEFRKVTQIQQDELGGLKPLTAEGSEFVIDCDTVVFATGQRQKTRLIAEGGGLERDAEGRVKFSPDTLATNVPNVFVAGDVVEARGSVIGAMASGRRAALSIDNLLMGRSLKNRADLKTPKLAPPHEKIYPAVRLEKLYPQPVPKARFRDTFDQVEGVYGEEQAVLEAKRCMKCGYSFVQAEECLGCGVCVNLCPARAISLVNVS